MTGPGEGDSPLYSDGFAVGDQVDVPDRGDGLPHGSGRVEFVGANWLTVRMPDGDAAHPRVTADGRLETREDRTR